VSWFEVNAYCKGLRESAGRDFRLPGEAEWEKAMRGTGGRLVPWGDRFDVGCCNTRITSLGPAMPVGHLSLAGDSPNVCAEMVERIFRRSSCWYR
jgi:formylglycine-generating enzyme required for sulfatase activity